MWRDGVSSALTLIITSGLIDGHFDCIEMLLA